MDCLLNTKLFLGSSSSLVVKVTGLPFTALTEDIGKFFAGADIKGGKKKGNKSLYRGLSLYPVTVAISCWQSSFIGLDFE